MRDNSRLNFVYFHFTTKIFVIYVTNITVSPELAAIMKKREAAATAKAAPVQDVRHAAGFLRNKFHVALFSFCYF